MCAFLVVLSWLILYFFYFHSLLKGENENEAKKSIANFKALKEKILNFNCQRGIPDGYLTKKKNFSSFINPGKISGDR